MNYKLRPAGKHDFNFAYEVKKLALGPHVFERWGWDEMLQQNYHKNRWQDRPWFIIELDDKRVGTVSVEDTPSHVQLGELYLLPTYQKQGLGSRILKEILTRADALKLSVRVEHLKWNPVASLYKRNDFVAMNENDTHCFLVRLPQPA